MTTLTSMTTLTIPINQTSLTTLTNMTKLNTPDHLHHPLTN